MALYFISIMDNRTILLHLFWQGGQAIKTRNTLEEKHVIYFLWTLLSYYLFVTLCYSNNGHLVSFHNIFSAYFDTGQANKTRNVFEKIREKMYLIYIFFFLSYLVLYFIWIMENLYHSTSVAKSFALSFTIILHVQWNCFTSFFVTAKGLVLSFPPA